MLIDESLFIATKPEAIWEYWMEVSNDLHWCDGITKAVWTTDPPHGIGTKGEHTHKDMGVVN